MFKSTQTYAHLPNIDTQTIYYSLPATPHTRPHDLAVKLATPLNLTFPSPWKRFTCMQNIYLASVLQFYISNTSKSTQKHTEAQNTGTNIKRGRTAVIRLLLYAKLTDIYL